MPDTAIEYALSLVEVTKTFGLRKAIDKVSFDLPNQAFLSIFGPNGAGKTTLLRMIATLSKPSSGTILVSGKDIKEQPDEIRSSIGLISHNSMLYGDLTPEENLVLYGRLYGVSDVEDRAKELLEVVGLQHRRKDMVKTFSRGMIQRASIARTLIHDPKLILLDEPYAGLDPRGVELLDQLLETVREDRTLIMVSHDLTKGLSMGTHMLVLVKGRITAFGAMQEFDSKADDFAEFYNCLVESAVS